MEFSRFRTGMAVRTGALLVTFVLAMWMALDTQWYVSAALVLAAALTQTALLYQFATQSGREVARFLDAIAFDDASQSFSNLTSDFAFRDLGAAMTRVIERLHSSRT